MKRFALVGCILALVGCSSAPDPKEPTPLEKIEQTTNLTLQWSHNLGSKSEITPMVWPAVQENRVYAIAGERALAIDLSGAIQWQRDLDAVTAAGTAVIGNQLVFVDNQGNVVSLNSDNGEQRWVFPWGREVVVPPVPGEGGMLVRSTDESVVLIDLEGQEVWQREGTTARLAYRGQAKPLSVDGGYVVPTDTGEVVAILSTDALNAWRRSFTGNRRELIDLDATPVVADDAIVIAGAQTGISSLDPSTGSVRWDVEVFSLLPLAADYQTVYATDLDGQVVAVNAASGEVLWRQTGLKFRFPSGPIATDAGIMVVDSLGVGHLLDTQNGAFIGRLKTGLSGTISLTAIEQDVLAMDNSGRLIRIGTGIGINN